jgi:shikimate dehydrogenase
MEVQINGHTKILGVIGDPIEHSLSPRIHNTLCKHLDLNYVYVPFRVTPDHLQDAVKGFKAVGITGFNVTIPHKKNIIRYLDEVSKEALLMGAVNTVKNIDGRLYGYNTDGDGFVKSLKSQGVYIKDKNIVMIGAGGSARGIAVKLAMEGARSIIILNRTLEKAQDISSMINNNIHNISQSDLFTNHNLICYAESCDILINTTPIGMYPDTNACPVEDLSFLNPGTVACDLIYNPEKTVFLSKAEEAGCKTVNGWGMLIFQAVSAFEIWTGVKVSGDLIKILHELCIN